MRYRKREAVLPRRSAPFLKPPGLLADARDHDQLLGRKVTQRILDRLGRVRVADARFDALARNPIGDFLSQLSCVSASGSACRRADRTQSATGPQARALLRIRNELEGNCCEEYAAGERRNKRRDTRGQP